MTYRITKVTLTREHEGRPDESYAFKTQDETENLSQYRSATKARYQATTVELNYTEIK